MFVVICCGVFVLCVRARNVRVCNFCVCSRVFFLRKVSCLRPQAHVVRVVRTYELTRMKMTLPLFPLRIWTFGAGQFLSLDNCFGVNTTPGENQPAPFFHVQNIHIMLNIAFVIYIITS